MSGREERFRPEDRLLRKAEFDGAFSAGERISSRSFTLILVDNKGARSRLGLTVSRKVGNAVIRNLVRRRLKEIFRRNRGTIPAPIDIVVLVKPVAAAAGYAELESEWSDAWRRYAARRRRTP